MPRTIPPPVCSKCGEQTPKADITVKRVSFKEYGKGGSVLRTRTTDYLCRSCLLADPEWDRPAYIASPGFEDTAPAREHREAVG